MKYYQISKDGQHIGVSTSDLFLRWQKKHNILVFCDINIGSWIMCGDTMYHDTWMYPEPEEKKGIYPQATVEEISENAYNALLDDMDIQPETNDDVIAALTRNAEYESIIREVITAETMALNSPEGEKLLNALHDAAKKENPNLTTKEWNQIKKNLLYYLFTKIVKPEG